MTKQQFQTEKTFQITMALADEMKEKGMITSKEYYDFNTKMVEKYHPIIGTLWLGIPIKNVDKKHSLREYVTVKGDEANGRCKEACIIGGR